MPSRRYCKLGKSLEFDDQRRFTEVSNGTQKVPSLARLNTAEMATAVFIVRSDRFVTGLFLQTIALRAARFSSARAGKQLRAGVRLQLRGVSRYRFPRCPRGVSS